MAFRILTDLLVLFALCFVLSVLAVFGALWNLPDLNRALPIEIVLQNDRRRSGVELRLSTAPVPLARGQAALGFPARQALINSHNRKACPGRKCFDERFNARGLSCRRPIEFRRQTDNYSNQLVVFFDQEINLRCHLPHRVAGALHGQRREWARERLRDVADREPDTPSADIDSQGAAAFHGFSSDPSTNSSDYQML